MQDSPSLVIFLGPPGSGKGTQAQHLAANFPHWVHISTGNLFRAEIASSSALGLSIKRILDSGELVSDEITNKVFQSQLNFLAENQRASVAMLDGYPRTEKQAQFLLDLCLSKGIERSLFIIDFQIDEQIIVERLSGRIVNPRTGRVYHQAFNPPKTAGVDDDGTPLVFRSDDHPDIVRSRFKLYIEQKQKILSGLGKGIEIFTINAADKASTISSSLEEIISHKVSVSAK